MKFIKTFYIDNNKLRDRTKSRNREVHYTQNVLKIVVKATDQAVVKPLKTVLAHS